MKRILLAMWATVVMVGCGGGGTGGGYNPPASPVTIFVTISPSGQTSIDAGQTVRFSATAENDSSGKGVNWSCSTTGPVESGCGTFTNATSSTATYNAPTSVSSNLSITVTATSIADTGKSSFAKVLVSPLPKITSTTLTDATPNTNYSAALHAEGGVAPLTWFVASGSLPAGLSLAGTGTISGTPTVPGKFTFTVQVTDSSTAQAGGPATAQAIISLTVVTEERISTTSLPAGTVGVAYVAQIGASGGTPPYTWNVLTGSLPSGLTLQPASGVISGTPTTPGNLLFTVQVTDSSPTQQRKSKSLTLTISSSGPFAITTSTLASATPNTNYTATLQASGGVVPLKWSLASGTLPTGLVLGGSGTISGNPTVPGCFTFTVQVTDSSAQQGGPATAQAQFSLTVVTLVEIITTSLPSGYAGSAYLEQISATGGTAPYTWRVSAGSLPSGLTLQPSSGTISGSPTTPGNFSFTVEATDSSPTPQYNTRSLSLAVGGAGTLAITTSELTNATPNTNYSVALQAAGGVAPLAWTLVEGILPTGLSLAGSGTISGDPTVPGLFTFTVQVTDSSTAEMGGPATAQAQLSLTVVTPVEITTRSLPAGSAGLPYLAQLSAIGGTAPYLWRISAGSLASGLTLQSASGAISGSPASSGNFTFTVEAKDSSPTPQSPTQVLTVAIGEAAPLAITTAALLDGTLNTPYNARVGAIGGTRPYRWMILSGALPSGISLNATTGAITGTPPATGTTYFTVQVTDASAAAQTQTQTLSLTVTSAAEACTGNGNNAVLRGSYAFSLSGFNDVGFITVVGAFTTDGTGRITAGEADANGVVGAQQGNIIAAASSYFVGPDNRGCATLATPFGTFTTQFALGSVSDNILTAGRMIEWDSPSSSAYIATGQILRQDLSSMAEGLSGGYVFRTIGWDPSAQGGREVCVGVLTAGNNTLNGLEQDCNDAWNIISTAVPTVAGTLTAFDTNGRGTGIVSQGDANSNITLYAVSNSKLLVVNNDAGPYASGEWDRQTVPPEGAGFTQASLKGNMVFYLNGLSMGGTASTVSMETASADGNGSLAINFYEDRAGTLQVSSPLTCTYAVEPSGRVILSSDTQGCGGNLPAFYLTAENTGFLMDAAPGVDTGFIEPQSAGPFNDASLQGNFFGGTDEAVIHTAQLEVAPVAINESGSMSGTTDLSSMSAQDANASFLPANCTVNPDGTFSLNSSGGTVMGVVISSSRFVLFSPATQATLVPTLLVMQK